MKLQARVFTLISFVCCHAIVYGDSPDIGFGASAKTGSSGSSVTADSSISYERDTSATSFQLSGRFGLTTTSEAESSVQWGAENAFEWHSAARIITQQFNFSHAEKEAIFSDKIESLDSASSITSFQLSRNPLLSHVAGLDLSYGHAYQSLTDGTNPSSEVSSWTLFDSARWAVTTQSRLSTNVSYKKTDAFVSNSSVGLGWTYLKNRQVYDGSVSYTFIDASGYESDQLGYSFSMSSVARTMNITAEVKKQVVDSLQLFQIVGIEETIQENVISSVTSASLIASDINAYDLAKVSVFITGGVSTQLVRYNQFDLELGNDSEFASTGIKLEAPIVWGVDMSLSANRGYQLERWSSIYSIDLSKDLNSNFNVAANSKLQDDTSSWSVSISYQH